MIRSLLVKNNLKLSLSNQAKYCDPRVTSKKKKVEGRQEEMEREGMRAHTVQGLAVKSQFHPAN